MSNTGTDINKRIAIGAGWTIAIRWADRVIAFVSIAILARLLLPVDFGLVGYALIILGILDEFFRFGFETVLIRDQDATADHYSTVWTLEIIKGLTLSFLIAITAQPVSAFFGEPKLEIILYWFAFIPVLRGLKNVGTVNFQKDLQFNKEFYLDVAVRLGGTVATVVLALLLRSYWALVYGAIFRTILQVILGYVMSDFRPRLCLSQYSRVLGFSKWLLAQNILSSMNARLPGIVIGRYFNAQALAFYSMAREITDLAKEFVGSPIRRALYPGITKMQDDLSQMSQTLKMAMGMIALVGLPVTIGIGITAPLFIPAFLGNNWIEVAPIVQILAVNAAIYLYYPNTHVVYYALDRPNLTAYISVLRLALMAPTVLLVVPEYGVIGAAWSLVAVTGFVMIIEYLVLLRLNIVTLSSVVSAVWRSTLAVIFMAVLVKFILENPIFLGVEDSIFLHLTLCIVTGVIGYVSAIVILWLTSGAPDGPEAYVLRMLKKIFNDRILVEQKP